MTATAATASTSVTDAAGLAKLRAQRVQLARTDVSTFCELVMRDEQTAAPVVLAGLHEEWHRLIDQHPRLVLHSFVESGKSSGVTVARALFELGRDPTRRIAIISNTQRQASKLLGSIGKYIETSTELREVFPGLVQGTPWASTSITVRRKTISKDPSCQALGIHGAVLGSRLDLVIVDDILDYENTRTQEQRLQAIQWFDSTVLGRVVSGGRVIVLGSAWHSEDVMHVLTKRVGWTHARYGVTDDDGEPRWPARWPLARIAEKRQELGPLEAARQLDCWARADETARFRMEWIADAFERAARSRLSAESCGTGLVNHVLNTPADHYIVCGVDLAVSKKTRADRSAIASVMVYPGGNRELLSIESGRWDAPEIIRRICSVNARYRPLHVVVETVAAQMYVAQMLRELSTVPVRDYQTGRGKMSLGFQAEALAVEMSNGKWIMRGARSSEVSELVRDMLYFSPTEHTGDRLVALLLARWGAEQTSYRAEWLSIDLVRR
jgi:hypothetical protein